MQQMVDTVVQTVGQTMLISGGSKAIGKIAGRATNTEQTQESAPLTRVEPQLDIGQPTEQQVATLPCAYPRK